MEEEIVVELQERLRSPGVKVGMAVRIEGNVLVLVNDKLLNPAERVYRLGQLERSIFGDVS